MSNALLVAAVAAALTVAVIAYLRTADNATTIAAQQVQINEQQVQITVLSNELNALKLSVLNGTTVQIQNGTAAFALGQASFDITNPYATALDLVNVTYRFVATTLDDTATFNILELDAPPRPLSVASDPGQTTSGYNFVTLYLLQLTPAVQQLTTLGGGTAAGSWIPLSTANAGLLAISPNCTVPSGQCFEAPAFITPTETSTYPSSGGVGFFLDNRLQPNSGVVSWNYISTTNSPSYVFVGSLIGWSGTLKLILASN